MTSDSIVTSDLLHLGESRMTMTSDSIVTFGLSVSDSEPNDSFVTFDLSVSDGEQNDHDLCLYFVTSGLLFEKNQNELDLCLYYDL